MTTSLPSPAGGKALPNVPSFVASLIAAGGEVRPTQITMGLLVGRAIEEELHAVLEAATGVGKTWGYLIPAIKANKTVVVSTANKTLQEQIFYKDVPLLQQRVRPFRAALVKGFQNYVCLERLTTASRDPQTVERFPEVFRLLDVVRQDADFRGDFETLPFTVAGELRARVFGDRDQCAWRDCEFFDRCYIKKMRDAANSAEVIVINHTLLLLNALLEGALLPEHEVVIVDEAHHLAKEARNAFTVSVRPSQVKALLRLTRLKDHAPEALLQALQASSTQLWQQIEQISFQSSSKVVFQQPRPEALKVASTLEEVAATLRLTRPQGQKEKEKALYDRLLTRVQNLANSHRVVFGGGEQTAVAYVRYVEQALLNQQVAYQACAAPLSVAPFLKEKLFDKTPTVIMASATLATVGSNPAKPEENGRPNFAYFSRQVGLQATEDAPVIERILPLIFNYEQHALLYLPRDIPEPVFGRGGEAARYTKIIGERMLALVRASRGRAFLLFSSRRMLDQVYAQLFPQLPATAYSLLRQGDMNRTELLRRFRVEQGAVLFGLESFWEGVDIAGEALSLVVIDKIPFPPPDDPVHEALVNQMKASGRKDWFAELVLPEVVLRLKQGLGRLLRSKTDRGVMTILDTRLYTKNYGAQILRALPPARRTDDLAEVERFFTTQG